MSASPSSLSTSSSSFSSSTRTSASHVPLRVAIYGKSLGGAHAQIIASYFSHTPTVRVVESASMSRKRRRDRRLRLFRHSNKNGAIDRGADEVIDEVAVSYCLRVVRIHTYGSVGICPLIAKRFHKSMKVHRCTICHVKRLVDEKEHKQKDEAHETETPSTPINTKNCEIIHFRNGGELNKNEMDHIPMVGGVLIGHNVTTMIESNQRNDALVSDSNITKDTSPLASLAGGKDEEQNNQSSLCGKGQGYSVCLVLLMWLGEVLQVRVNETENSSSTSSKAHDQTKHYHDAVKFRDSNEEFVADPREHARKGDNDTYMLPSDKNNEFDAHQCLFYYASDRRHHFDMIVGACYLRSFRAHSRQSTLFFHHHHLKCHRRSRNINNEDRRVNQTDTVSDELENSQSLSGTDRVEVAQENRYLSVYFKDLSEFERMLRIGILIFDSNDIFYGEGEELIRKNDENDTTATAEGVIKKESTISNQIDRENEISWILESELCRGKQLEFARKLLSSIFCVVPKPRSHALYAVDTSVRNGDCFRSSTDDEESIIAEKEKHDDSWKKLKKKKKTKCICRSPDSWQQRESNHHSNDHQNGDGDETEHAHQEKLFLRRKCICYEKLWKNYYLKSNVFDHMSSRERRQYQRLQKSHNEEHIADHSNRKSHGRTSLGFKNRIHHQLDNLMSYDILDITPRVHFSVVPLNHKKGVKSGTVAREVQCRGRVNSEKNTDVDDRDLRKVISRSLKSSQLIMLPTASAILTTNSALSRTSSMGDGAANNEG